MRRVGGLAAWVEGDGPPVVLLHAGVADSRMWPAPRAAFAPGHRVIAYDRRGFGATAAADVAYSQVDDLLAVLSRQPEMYDWLNDADAARADAARTKIEALAKAIRIRRSSLKKRAPRA